MTLDLTTFVFEIVNFVVLVFILQRAVYLPLRRSLDARRKTIEARESAATARMTEAEDLARQVQARSRELDVLRADAMRKAGEEAAAERARLIALAREDAAGDRARAQRTLDAEREAARAWVEDLAVERSTELAGQVHAALAPEAVHDALFALLVREVAAQGTALRAELPSDGPVEVRATFARPPVDAETDALRGALREALGADVRLVVADDPALRAGAVVRVAHRVLDASLDGQLDVLRERVRAAPGVSEDGDERH
jgi:F-type H+-transporting ATPase subunit b